ncbi:glycosyltransferase [Pedobacter nyackensis]|uniref:glycosyltransferase n=1 Tax=Pedobacter nyackensis TaxID=475255 RepID=UPI00292F77B7|nr:glycosyltransferase [Pedobacter nyackensis]
MKNFKPFTIEHLQVDQLDQFSPSRINYYLVFWWKNIPLGHIWLYNEDDSFERISFNQKVLEAIEKTVAYYASVQGKGDQTFWKNYLLASDKENLKQELDLIIPLQIDGKADSEKLSIVICTRNRPQAIDDCVKALMASHDKDFELIVVDNAPDDDRTEQVIKKYPDVKYVKEPLKGLDVARNTGARYATHGIIAYTDDDVIVEPNWSSLLKTVFRDPKTMAVTGLVIPVSLKTKAQYTFEKDWGFNKGYLPKIFGSAYFDANVNIGVPAWEVGAGANMAFRREVFDLVGWFDERLDVGASGCSGDSEFWYRIMAEGYQCNYYPQLFVYHQHREEMASLKSQIFNYMRGQVSSIFVQYENYHHSGDLFRLKKSLPNYYARRIYQAVKHLSWSSFFETLNEIHGCISGWLFYRKHRNVIREGSLLYLKSLKENAVVDERTVVSVVIPCYNHGRYLSKAIESILGQTHRNTEIIVVDDGSTDNTVSVCNSYPNVKYVRTERLGLSGARNTGIRYSTGNYLVFLDADDYLYADAFKINLKYFSDNGKVVFVSGSHDKVDDEGNLLPTSKPAERWAENYEGLLNGNYIAMEATVMYRKELFYSFFFDPQLKACEDYDINLNITRYFPTVTHTEKIAAYRIHGANMSADKILMLDYVMKVLERQKSKLRSGKQIEAYEAGVKVWQDYYTS